MSNECSTIVWKRQFGSMTRKLIAARLADHADDEGRGIWPSVERVAAQCDTSERTVKRTLADFVKEGLLRVVHEGGKGPGDTRRYDFNMIVLKALPVAQWGLKPRETPVNNDSENGSDKGDSVSPLSGAKGDTETNKGDTDDQKGCHSVTQTTIEPSLNPQKARERVKEDSLEAEQEKENLTVSVDAWKRRFKKIHKDWPSYLTDSDETAETEWFNLSEADRQKAFDLTAIYVAEARRVGRTKFCAFSKYLNQKRWEKLSADALQSSSSIGVAAPFGKVWNAVRLVDLLGKPRKSKFPPTRWQQQQIEQGGEAAQRIILERQVRYGWPRVNTMHERAIRERRGVPVPAEIVPLGELFGKVGKGSELWHAWKSLHEKRGWPWFGADRQCPEWIWMPDPPGEPESYSSADAAVEAALTRFQSEHATITERQAAE